MSQHDRKSIAIGTSEAWDQLQQPGQAVGTRQAVVTTACVPAASGLLRVLLVDDDQDTVNTLSTLVEFWGHDVRRAYDAAAALEISAAYQPDVVLVDIGMPRLDGCHVARQLRRQARFQRTLLIAVTGWGDQGHRRLGESAGFDLYLIKPVEPQILALLLSETARLAQAHASPALLQIQGGAGSSQMLEMPPPSPQPPTSP